MVCESQGMEDLPSRGDLERPADARLMETVMAELRALAAAFLREERRGPTLQTTALVNEAWLRLSGRGDLGGAGRDAYLSLAAQAIRRILVDHARRRDANKRGGGHRRVELDQDLVLQDSPEEVDHAALDEALSKLARLHERQARIVELRFFAGLEVVDVARILAVSPRTVASDWAMAKAFLHAELSEPGEE